MTKRREEPAQEPAEEAQPATHEKLEQIAAESPLDLATLSGDLRDTMLELFRHRPKLWDQMPQAEQRDVSYLIEQAVITALSRATQLLAAEGRPSIHARLEKFTAKGGKYQAALVTQGGPELASDLARLDGHVVLIISADAKEFRGERGPVALDPDQRPLELDEELPERAPDDPFAAADE
jgi:hypothetical protein